MDAALREAQPSAHGLKWCRHATMMEYGIWNSDITNANSKAKTINAKVLVNAAGPWVSAVLRNLVGHNEPDKIRQVEGSHLVVDKPYDHDRCYIFQNADGRICLLFLMKLISHILAPLTKTTMVNRASLELLKLKQITCLVQ